MTRTHELPPLAIRAKRALDVVAAGVGLVLSSPLWLVCSILIKASGRGPVFYRQQRFGHLGVPFTLLKFRTMRWDPSAPISPATVDDQRVTSVGKVLRRMGLDELPQLLSILRGDMSLVGPRALAVGETIYGPEGEIRFQDVPGFAERLRVKPGLTGLATVYLPKDADPLQKLEYDLRYIREYSFWLDVRLILMSLRISFQGRWEMRDPKL